MIPDTRMDISHIERCGCGRFGRQNHVLSPDPEVWHLFILDTEQCRACGNTDLVLKPLGLKPYPAAQAILRALERMS